MSTAIPTIEALGLKKSFGDVPVLKGVDLCAYPSEIVCILGTSGAGKSTLLRCLNLLEVPDEGEVRINGTPIALEDHPRHGRRAANPEQLTSIRCNLGMVFQQFNLWQHLRVRDNIGLGLRKVLRLSAQQAREKTAQALEMVEMSDFADQFPAQLSGGQQQRIAIARVLAMEPNAILFDEPTSALDPKLVSEVTRLIASLATQQRTIIIVTHEVSVARSIATQIVFLNQGTICEQGTPDYFFRECQSPLVRKFLANPVSDSDCAVSNNLNTGE